jgi:hypothetical protein
MPTGQVVNMNTLTAACVNAGGINYLWVVEAKYISAIAVTADVITGFTMTETGKWKRWNFSLDNTANYNQVANRNGNRRTETQTGFVRWTGIDATLNKAAADAMLTCEVVVIYVTPNGQPRLVQGLEIDASAVGGFVLSAGGERTLLLPSVNTDVSQGESRIEMTIQGVANNLSPSTTLTDSALAAL